MHTAFRYDTGKLGQVTRTDDDRMYAPGSVCRDGILTYHRKDGATVREYRPPEENQNPKFLNSLAGLTVTFEHPGTQINGRNRKAFQVGHLDSVGVYNAATGEVEDGVWVTDSEAIGSVESREVTELSLGYACDIEEKQGFIMVGGQKQHYDSIQRNIRPNHCALTRRGRAGPSISLKLDSGEDPPDIAYAWHDDSEDNAPILAPPDQKPKSTTKKRTDSKMKLKFGDLEFEDVAPEVVVALQPVLSGLPVLQSRVDSLTQENDELADKLAAAERESLRNQGRADGLEEFLAMQQAGTTEGVRDDMGDKKKKPPMAEDEDMSNDPDDPDEPDADDADMEYDFKKKKGSKNMKDDSQEKLYTIGEVAATVRDLVAKGNQIRMDAMQLADALDIELDIQTDLAPELTPSEIQVAMLTAVNADSDYSDKSKDYIEARFDALKEFAVAQQARQDSQKQRDDSKSDRNDGRSDLDTLRMLTTLSVQGLPSRGGKSTTRADAQKDGDELASIKEQIRRDSIDARSGAYKTAIN
jgi:hypothetical protein